jgi:ABC-type sulfate transport system permease subunit
MDRKTKLTVWLALGIALTLTPIMGTVPGILAQVTAFRHLDEAGARAVFDEGIHVSVWLTLAGLVVCPVGIVIVVVSAIKLGRHKSTAKP